jgi:hypothetical protein
MKPGIRVFLITAWIVMAGLSGSGQVRLPAETRNAALRYWLAFAEIQDATADKATQDLLERTAAGVAPWDESRLGSILDRNLPAIQRMQRATNLPECDWGLEYDHKGSIAHAPRARVLARLNTLEGIRLKAKGDLPGAVSAWVAGIRFSQHVAQGGSLVFTLVAQSTLLPNLRELAQAAESGGLRDADRRQIETVARALPESGFDWGNAMRTEEALLYAALDEVSRSSQPAAAYAALLGVAPGSSSPPTPADRSAYNRLMLDIQQALRQPTTPANEAKLQGLARELEKGSIHAFFRQTTPDPMRVQQDRVAVVSARTRLLQALGQRK